MSETNSLRENQSFASLLNGGSRRLKVAVTDIDGILRGKYLHINKFASAARNGFGFCDVVFGWDCADVCYDNSETTGWHTGYPDAHVTLDESTLRSIPWEDNIPFVLGDFSPDQSADGGSLAHQACPRSFLKHVLRGVEDSGVLATCGMEFEWFNFAESSRSLEEKSFVDPTPLTPGMFGYSLIRQTQNQPYFRDLMQQLEEFGIPLEGLHTETGPGVFEGAILCSEALEAADRAVLFKSGVKQIAHQHGILPSFMARWDDSLPGTSGHIHLSLWDKTRSRNLFYDADAPAGMSDTMRHFLAGILRALPDLCVFFAPTVNSYKRLVPGYWAPTAATWGVDNRTVAIRVIPGDAKSQRIEFRVCGADFNPYIGLGALLAAGQQGIAEKLTLDVEQTRGNGYAQNLSSQRKLPQSLFSACERLRSTQLLPELIPRRFAEHFLQTREWEWEQSLKAVTDWERKRYFEII